MDVSSEALRTVKAVLKTFKSDIEGTSALAISQSQSCFDECREIIAETLERVQELESRATQLTKTIQDLEQKIAFDQNTLQQIDRMLPQLEQRLHNLHMQLSELSDRLSTLKAQLANTEDEDEQQRIQYQINIVQNQMNMVWNSIQDIEQQIRQSKEKRAEFQKSISGYSAKKEECENELSVEKKRLNQYQQKLEKLNVASRNVDADFKSYIQSVKKFETSSVESADNKHRLVDECISIIEDMESVI